MRDSTSNEELARTRLRTFLKKSGRVQQIGEENITNQATKYPEEERSGPKNRGYDDEEFGNISRPLNDGRR